VTPGTRRCDGPSQGRDSAVARGPTSRVPLIGPPCALPEAMGQLLRRLWNDEAAFRTAMRSVVRFGIAFLGYLLEQGIVPTGIPGGGSRYGMLLIVLAFLVSAGKQNADLQATPAREPKLGAAA
jgi:hypothetical protein